MTNAEFLEHAFTKQGPKLISGFSRPVYHNLMGVWHGHQFNKKNYGGMMRHTEAAMLYQWARALPPESVIVEIGCYGGLSTSYLARGCQKNRSKVYAIDPFDSDLVRQEDLCDQKVSLDQKPSRRMVQQRIRAAGLDAYVELIEGFSQDVAKVWKTPVQFLWIDGNHDRAYEDYTEWLPFLAPGARVAVHDAHPRYGYPAVVDAVRKIFGTDEWESLEHVKSIITGLRKRSLG